jgi:hypothetical protein
LPALRTSDEKPENVSGCWALTAGVSVARAFADLGEDVQGEAGIAAEKLARRELEALAIIAFVFAGFFRSDSDFIFTSRADSDGSCSGRGTPQYAVHDCCAPYS